MQRSTPQRRAIARALQQADRPLAPQEILDLAVAETPGLGMATVYRTVRAGVEEGWLHPIDLPGSPTRYEMAGKGHHHHFACRACDAVYEVQGCPGNFDPLAPNGFKLEDHEVVLYGLCASCNE